MFANGRKPMPLEQFNDIVACQLVEGLLTPPCMLLVFLKLRLIHDAKDLPRKGGVLRTQNQLPQFIILQRKMRPGFTYEIIQMRTAARVIKRADLEEKITSRPDDLRQI